MLSTDLLVCPETRLPLRLMPRTQAELQIFDGPMSPPRAVGYQPIGLTEEVMVREDGGGAYPVKDGVPALLVPEMLVASGQDRVANISDPKYAEAYSEMEYYSREAEEQAADVSRTLAANDLSRLVGLSGEEQRRFPAPRNLGSTRSTNWLRSKRPTVTSVR